MRANGASYQATTSEDTAGWEDLVCAVVNCRAHELAIALELLAVTIQEFNKFNYQS
jgi:hypothetical protein